MQLQIVWNSFTLHIHVYLQTASGWEEKMLLIRFVLACVHLWLICEFFFCYKNIISAQTCLQRLLNKKKFLSCMSWKKINSSIHIALLNQQHDAEKDVSKKERDALKEHTLSRKFLWCTNSSLWSHAMSDLSS